jgi:hypothetical protein
LILSELKKTFLKYLSYEISHLTHGEANIKVKVLKRKSFGNRNCPAIDVKYFGVRRG